MRQRADHTGQTGDGPEGKPDEKYLYPGRDEDH